MNFFAVFLISSPIPANGWPPPTHPQAVIDFLVGRLVVKPRRPPPPAAPAPAGP